MAEETPVSPIAAAEPPKVNPLGGPVPGATQTALKPGLKLPPKPGATASALRPGLKLPPKPGATVSALRPGLKLPPKPGATSTAALKPGLKLPTRPVIHKPGATVAAKPLPKPITGGPVPPSAADMKPETPAPANAPKAVPVDAQGIGKLPTVEAQAIAREDIKPVVSENPKPMEALKTVTQKLKGITQQIPQQAILRKTGIIAEDAMTDAQKQAAKSKTARISLSDAMGVAPVKNENAPMKTIRIKRPVDIPGSTNAKLSPVPPSSALPAAPSEEDAESKEATITQRKTLKISRPGGGAVRPTGKFGIKRPVSQATTGDKSASTAGEGAAPAPADGAVADIPDIPSIPEMPAPVAQQSVSDGPTWLWTLSALVQVAACVAIGALAWFLYQNTQTQYF